MIGQRIGAYQVTRLFREGRFATSYEAEDDGGGRALIKVLSPEGAEDEELRKRFLNEARAVSAIEHPAMLRVLGSGELDGGLPYFIGEHPGGESLLDRQ